MDAHRPQVSHCARPASLARYYKRAKKLPPTWKYESSTASAMVA